MTITAPAAARFMRAFREYMETEHEDGSAWAEQSGEPGHRGLFETCPHENCQLARLDIIELQSHRLHALIVAKDARLAAGRFSEAVNSRDLMCFPGEANVNARAAAVLTQIAEQLENGR